MNFHILAKKNFGPGVANNKFTTVRMSYESSFQEDFKSIFRLKIQQYMAEISAMIKYERARGVFWRHAPGGPEPKCL